MFDKLRHLGLSENEAKVYMAMLELGPSVVVEIARKSGINRPTTYVQIESLKKKGLVSTQAKGKKQFFIAESPDKLELLIEKQLKTGRAN
jgi:sugar-specific transcriptional regulator TrmB